MNGIYVYSSLGIPTQIPSNFEFLKLYFTNLSRFVRFDEHYVFNHHSRDTTSGDTIEKNSNYLDHVLKMIMKCIVIL